MQHTEKDRPQQHLVEVLNRISDGCFAVDHQWQITFVNSSLEQTLAIRRSEVLHRNLWQLYPHLKETEFERQFFRAVNNNAPVTFEHYAVNHQRWFEVTAHPSATGLSVLLRDSTERKRVDEELRMLSLVAKETTDAVVMLSPESRITWVNAAFTRMTGYSAEEALGQQPSILLQTHATNPGVLRYINEQLQENRPVETEILSRRKNGELFWSELYIQPLLDANGRLEQYFSIRKEITRRKKLEQELDHQQKEFTAAILNTQEQERAAVGRELHDNVNQVLTTVKLYQELLLSGQGDFETLAHRSMHLLQQSIDEIRSLSKRLSAPSLGNITLADSVQELVDAVDAARRFELVLDAACIAGLRVADELHLAVYRILQEHLTNIAKHAAASAVQVSCHCRDRKLTLTVTDNGTGFDPRQKTAGTGLANMRMRAGQLGGSLTIISAPGQGCSLVACFPFEEVPQ